MTVDDFLRLVADGALSADDRVELLEGVVVAMAPSSPRHAGTIAIVSDVLRAMVGARAAIRVQLPLAAGAWSLPEPDVAVVEGLNADYVAAHPASALLVVEVSESSVAQDRLTKAAIYAAARIPEYWLVNLRDDRVEVHRDPDPDDYEYRSVMRVGRGERVELVTLPGVVVVVDDLLPPRHV